MQSWLVIALSPACFVEPSYKEVETELVRKSNATRPFLITGGQSTFPAAGGVLECTLTLFADS